MNAHVQDVSATAGDNGVLHAKVCLQRLLKLMM